MNWSIVGGKHTNNWCHQRTTILEFNRFLTDFSYELSHNKCEQLLPSSIIGSWRFFRARVDQLHVSNNASHIFFSVAWFRYSFNLWESITLPFAEYSSYLSKHASFLESFSAIHVLTWITQTLESCIPHFFYKYSYSLIHLVVKFFVSFLSQTMCLHTMTFV
jgi:hypothetical protein